MVGPLPVHDIRTLRIPDRTRVEDYESPSCLAAALLAPTLAVSIGDVIPIGITSAQRKRGEDGPSVVDITACDRRVEHRLRISPIV